MHLINNSFPDLIFKLKTYNYICFNIKFANTKNVTNLLYIFSFLFFSFL